jgi:hypothetical protein
MPSTRRSITAIASSRRSSVPEQIAQLFAEYADAYARGERPRAEEYLARAGGHADELAGLLERFVQAVPARNPDVETIALTEAWLTGEPPLVNLRASQGVRVDEVVDALVERLGLDPAKRAKVKRYYQRLEGGLLEPSRVSRKVWDVLTGVVGPRSEELAAWHVRPVAAEPVYLRAAEPVAAPPQIAGPGDEAPDEIDLLFLGEEQ